MATAHKELEVKYNAVVMIQDELTVLPEPILKEHHNYVKSRFKCFPSLTVFFRHLRLYFWNFFEYELLEHLIERECSEMLNSKMVNYVSKVKSFQQRTILTEFIKCGHHLVKEKSIPPNFKDMVTEHSVDPDDYTLLEMEDFRKDLHRLLNMELSECALQMYTIECNRIVVHVQWIFPEELTDTLVYAEYQELMEHYCVEKLMIEGKSLHSVRLLFFFILIVIHVCILQLSLLKALRDGDINRAMSTLLHKDLEVDINCPDHVRIHHGLCGLFTNKHG